MGYGDHARLPRSEELSGLRFALHFASVWALTLLAGCASPQKMYFGSEPQNLVVRTRVEGSPGTSAGAALDVHRLESRCKMHYEGRFWLDQAEMRTGVPVDVPMYLSFAFASKDFLSMRGGSVRQATTFVARPGYSYIAEVSYVRGIYDVVLRETPSGLSGGRVLELRPLPPC